MKHLFFLLLIPFHGVSLHAQELVSSSGGHGNEAGAQFSWSVGEVVVSSYVKQEAVITQGFHQNTLTVTRIYDVSAPECLIKVFPNPTIDNIELKIEGVPVNSLSYQLLDANGRVLHEREITVNNLTVQTEALNAATYFLKVIRDNKHIKTFKIIKK